ncbi:site-specific integrase [Deinococcus peraridilitoris]|uniref:Site-specific recombinase XerD n=1 Tax=Deinococcus peraridilitoris (strain DSM 19664 / LMG 22246 / CIP 109416 / KR-200) TaxID=937777 RepID=L0A231_DEIPD|nr:site-specific integrase [Deinococcus peraridilitoris]AFZ67504.1 site-specific recombinase XerD [Deinococcus peraridilitoris DSM 19664]
MTHPSGRTRLTRSQIIAVMEACGPRRDELVIGLLGLQGLRPRQVSWLLYGDFDFERQTLTLIASNAEPHAWPRSAGQATSVPLDPDLAKAVHSYARYDRNAPRRPQDPLLSQHPGENRPITPEQVNHVVRKVSRERRAELGTEFTVADLRWSCAQNLLDESWPLEDIATLLGHTSRSVQKFLERGFD